MRKLIIILSLSLSMLILGACTPQATSTPVPEDTEVATEVAVVESTPTQVIPTEVEPEIDNCVVCHTDKQMLIDTAIVEEEATEAESEGVG